MPSPILTIKAIRVGRLKATESVLYIKADGSYSYFYFSDGSRILTSRTLKYWQSRLCPDRFFSPHRSYLVNWHHVRCIDDNSKSLLIADYKIAISRRRWQDCIDKFNARSTA